MKETFSASGHLREHPAERDYRLENSYRVANIAKTIAEREGFDVTHAVIAGLLHDIAYCEEMTTEEDWKNHGRRSAAIARPFLVGLGLPADAVNEICYGIAIHVDDQADFEWKPSAFCETVGDADNIDRFDAYRIYETLQSRHFSELPLTEKRDQVEATLEKLNRLKSLKLGTSTACGIWEQRIEYYISFYEKLKQQLAASNGIRSAGYGGVPQKGLWKEAPGEGIRNEPSQRNDGTGRGRQYSRDSVVRIDGLCKS